MAVNGEKKLLEWELRPDLIHSHSLNENDLSIHSDFLDHFLEDAIEYDFDEPLIEDFGDADFEIHLRIVVSWIQQHRELFMVPKLQHFSALKKNEVVAAFINFLVQFLSHGLGSIFSLIELIVNLKGELRFLAVVIGDSTSLLWSQNENVLAEFEAVAMANEAGSSVYSLFSVIDITVAVGALFEHIELLKDNLIKSSNHITTLEVDSFSIIAYVLVDLEEIISREDDDLIVCEIEILQQGLMLSQSFLNDIKLLRLSEIDNELNEVMLRIRDVGYESEHLINSFLVGDVPLWYLKIRISNVIHKVKLIENGLQDIEKNYDVGALKVAKNFSKQLSLQTPRNSDIVVGLEDKTIEILDQLIGGKEHLHIITIFGMPGLGKTTLAKNLYFHPSVNYYFDKRSWCIISQAYHRKSILIDILIGLQSDLDRDKIFDMVEESLVEQIYKCLYGRRYLIVMDDIWNSNVWDDLRRCFPDNRNGSRILFTSRNQDVGPLNSVIHELPILSNEQAWELLQRKVFGDETCPSQLLDIGNQIAVSCCGLPLAVVVVAGILLTLDWDRNTWENVGTSLASYIFADKNNSTMQILELSYKHLPGHLKPCFLYFGAFGKVKEDPFASKENSMMPVKHGYKYVPDHLKEVSHYPGAFWEDKEVHVRTLKRLWIAEGFIRKQEGKSLESIAEEYLMELIGKSLVIVTGRRSDGGVKSCVIHDLLHELCSRRAKEEKFLTLVDINYSIYSKHRRLYAPSGSVSLDLYFDASDVLFGRYGLHVRSFIGYFLRSPLSVVSMELLRVLDCWNTKFVEIETLVHLRYLAITTMPDCIANFVNLEFLIVHTRVIISSSVLKMVKLRYFQSREALFDEDCYSSQMDINNLEYLSTVCIFNLEDENMLKCSPHLQKLKCECEPLSMDDEGTLSYRYPDLGFLTKLESLSMAKNSYGDAKDAGINFPPNVKKLTLYLLRLPWEKISIIGALRNLEILKLEADAIVGEIWETRDGEFQQLRILKLVGLNLFKWDVLSGEHFPKLQQLVLHKCWNMQEISREIGEIETLQLIEVNRCRKSVAESAIRIQEEQRDMGNEDLRIIIRN